MRSIDKIRAHNAHEITGMMALGAAPRCGLVTSFNPATMRAKVAIQPDGQITGWLPVLSQWVGVGWGIVAPLQPNDQVLVLAEENDAAHGVIVGRYFSDVDTPPQGAAAGELWMVHQTGSTFAMKADGSVLLITATLNIQAPGGGDATVNITGNLIVSEKVTASDLVLPSIPSTDSHTHTSNTPGQPTSPPISGT
jgi:phage baseplate assembly protein V